MGPVVVTDGDRDLGVGRPLERAALVRLALARGMPVPDTRLAADLWGEQQLNRPVERLRVLMSRLRAAVGSCGHVVLRSPAGYRTSVTIADLAAAQAAADLMHAAQRAGDHEAVRAAADAALRLWRGPALADLTAAPFARAEAARLEEWRLGLVVAGADAALRLGAAAEIRTQLAASAAEHPLHEPLVRLYVLALYQTGSHVEALDRLRRLRRTLSEDLGVDPAPETADLELRILRHDPTLRPSGASAAAPQRSARSGPVLILDDAAEVTEEVRAVLDALVSRMPDLTVLVTSQRLRADDNKSA
ncbi:AfsR/SARP family transcriptional regulator [Nocardia transvalensis]|uniref:AfsR/SARP family transcriptional regulator n=1 Tax=Nocardia transvalensis TaxID=37333 RepID=UPI0018953154|nr:BTAD domain-containing putative transcriptional regulator [Nocardia transvalensis]MBF6328333.1 hypothetical protein [Nocardia transvalensis]